MKTSEVKISEARRRLPALLDELKAGEEFVITLFGRPIGRLTRYAPAPALLPTRRAVSAPPAPPEEASGKPGIDPIVKGLIRRLPPSGTPWPPEARKLWLEVLEGTFELVYTDADPPHGHRTAADGVTVLHAP